MLKDFKSNVIYNFKVAMIYAWQLIEVVLWCCYCVVAAIITFHIGTAVIAVLGAILGVLLVLMTLMAWIVLAVLIYTLKSGKIKSE